MAIKFEENNNFIVSHISDVFKQAEMNEIKGRIRKLSETSNAIRVLVIIETDFINLEDAVNWNDDTEDDALLKKVKQLAIVGDLRWRDKALLFALDGITPVAIEYFPPEQIELAKAWLS